MSEKMEVTPLSPMYCLVWATDIAGSYMFRSWQIVLGYI